MSRNDSAAPNGQSFARLNCRSITLAIIWLSERALNSPWGRMMRAIRDNELRVEYMGGSVSHTMAINFVMAAFLAGMGGALAVMALGHIDPNFSYWTTSGEYVFVAILAGSQSVLAVLLSAVVLEVVRSFSSLYF